MKINKLYLGLIGLMALTFAACNDDDDYTRSTISGNQVYFSKDLPTKQSVDVTSNTFVIPVNRQETAEAITVPLIVTGADTTVFSVPSSISFAQGSNQADLVLSYDPNQLVYGDYRGITIQIGDESYTTPYGLSRYEFTIGVTDWDEWYKYNDDGTCDYIYVNYWTGTDPKLKFYERDNLITTNLHQFRIDNWGPGTSLILTYDEETGIVSLGEDQYLTNNSNYGAVRICDSNYYWDVIRNRPLDEKIYGYFDEEQGIIGIPIAYYVSAGYFGYDYEYVYINGFVRADVTAEVSYAGKLIASDESPWVIANVELGDDVTSAKVGICAGNPTQEMIDAMIDDTYEEMETIKASGEVRFPMKDKEDGAYSFVVITYLDKEPMEVFSTSFKYELGGAKWESLGMGYYVDDGLTTWFGIENIPYQVEILASSDKPGIYRLVNPYGAAFPYNEDGDWDASRDWNIDVNAADPEGVYIPKQETGLDWSYGMYIIQSLGAYYMEDGGYDFDTVKGAGYMGKLVDGHITFPERGIIVRLGTDYGPSYGNKNLAHEIILPGAASNIKAVKARMTCNREMHKVFEKVVRKAIATNRIDATHIDRRIK